jgi:hydroxyacylglutathione hydrolase
MTLRFEQFLGDGIAQLSYLIGDDAEGTAAVVDPLPDVEVYIDFARRYGLAITHVFETHIHADFMSGARELAARIGNAAVWVSEEGGATYGFDHQGLRDGDRFTFGKAVLTARFTPGHTPEHTAFLLAEAAREETPWGVLSGDSLFVDSVGRPDLLGDEMSEQLGGQLFRVMREFYLELEDSVIVYPCHGAGSACGPDIGDRLSSTIGYERRHNPYLQPEDQETFEELVFGNAPPVPTHYPRLKKINAAGPDVLGAGPIVPPLPPETFQNAMQDESALVIDCRNMLGFAGGHVPRAVNIAAEPILSVWAGWLLDPGTPLLLVLERDGDLKEVVQLFVRTGYTRFGGYLAGGMEAWQNAGLPLSKLGRMSAHELRQSLDEIQVLDVRKPEEWEQGHIPGARHCFLGNLLESTPDLAKDRPVAVYCASGYRAHLAASILKRRGFEDVRGVPGSWQAWTGAGFPVES